MAIRMPASIFFISLVCLVNGFLIACASSKMIQSHVLFFSGSIFAAIPYVVIVKNGSGFSASFSNATEPGSFITSIRKERNMTQKEIANNPKRKKTPRILIMFEILLSPIGEFLLAYTAFQEYYLWRMMKWYIDIYWKDPVHHITMTANSPFPVRIAIGIACFSIAIILMTIQLIKLKRSTMKPGA